MYIIFDDTVTKKGQIKFHAIFDRGGIYAGYQNNSKENEREK